MNARLPGAIAAARGPFCLALALCAGAVGAAGPPPVQARLVADRAQLEAGGTVQVGVLFAIAKGWHIYWKNPGDCGLATAVHMTPPPGLTAAALQWPLPERFTDAGGLVSYGYEHSVLLAAELQLPPDLPAHPGPLRAAVSWLACKDRCTRGQARLELELPPPAPAVEKAAFRRWREELARPTGAAGAPFELTVLGGLADGAREGDLTLWLRWAAAPRRVQLYPEAGQKVKVDGVRVRSRGELTRIDMTLHVLGDGGQRVRELPAIVAVTDAGARRGYEVRLPINRGS